MDFLESLRLRGLFGGNDPKIYPINGPSITMRDTTGLFDTMGPLPNNKGVGSPEASENTSPLNSPDSNLRAQRQRARPYMDQYAEMLKSEPTRENYQLSKIGKALAAGSGMLTGAMQGSGKGIDTFRSLADEPLRRAREDYSVKGGRLKELAGIEQTKLDDEYKLEVAIAADESKRRDDIRQQMLAESTKEYNSARIADLNKRGAIVGQSMVPNQLTGYIDIHDLNNKTITPTKMKVLETPGEKDAREFKTFKEKFGIEQAGRKEMEGVQQGNRIIIKGMDNAHDQFMENLRSSNDRVEIKLRDNLTKLSSGEQGKAFDNAYKQTLLLHPAMQTLLFDQDDKGNLSLKKDYDPNLHNLFTSSVKQTMKQMMGDPSDGISTGSVSDSDPTVRDAVSHTISGGTSGTTSPGAAIGAPIDPATMRAMAVADLQTHDFPASEENIAKWVKQKQAESTGQVPQVTMPPQEQPIVTMDGSNNPINAMMSRNAILGNSRNPRPPLGQLAPTNPGLYGPAGEKYKSNGALTPEEQMRLFGQRSGNFVQQLPNIVFGGR